MAHERQVALSQKAWLGAAARTAYRHTLYRVCKHQIRRGWRAARSSTSQRSAQPLCARVKDADGGVSDKNNLSLATVCFFPTRVNKERWTSKILRAFFWDVQGFGRLKSGSRAGFTGSGPPSLWSSVLQFSLFLHDVWP